MSESWIMHCPSCNHELPHYVVNNVYIVDVVCEECGWSVPALNAIPIFDSSDCPYDDIQFVWSFKPKARKGNRAD